MNDLSNTAIVPSQGEWSFADVAILFRESWKLLLLLTAAGILAATTYIVIAEEQYQATAQVQMAQAPDGQKDAASVVQRTVTIEDANLLMARLKVPSTYTTEAINACGLQNKPNAGTHLARLVKVVAVKNVPNVIELRIERGPKESTQQCVAAIFGMVRQQQEALVKPYIEDINKRLGAATAKLAERQDLLTKLDKSALQSAAYLAARDDAQFLQDRIEELNANLLLIENRTTKLISPIYVTDEPVWPHRPAILVAGAFFGLMLGIAYSLTRYFIKQKSTN